jgi:hypothetical protein
LRATKKYSDILLGNPEHEPTLNDYIEYSYNFVNAFLRTDGKKLSGYEHMLGGKEAALPENRGKTVKYAKEQIRYMDNMFNEVDPRTHKELTAYRVVGPEVFKNVKIGEVIEDKGFVSTTLNPGTMSEFYGDEDSRFYKDDNVTLLEIKVPKNTSALFVPGIKSDYYKSNQAELLLNRGTKFKVVSKEGNKLHLEVVPEVETEIVKGFIVEWDGDGLQGKGQHRDARGRWARLPGKSKFDALAIVERAGEFLVIRPREFKGERDDDRIVRRFKTEKGAQNFVDREAAKDEEDQAAYRKYKKEFRKKKKEIDEAREKHSRYLEQKAERERAALTRNTFFSEGFHPKAADVKEKREVVARVRVGAMERLPFPGKPSSGQITETQKWLKQNYPDSEAKYGGLLLRLLANKGITQDPAQRKKMADRYGITPKRLMEVEEDLHDHLFPQTKAVKPRRQRDLRGGGFALPEAQRKEMEKNGAHRGIPLAEPENFLRPERLYRADKGPNKGKWLKTDAKGNTEVVSNTYDAKVKKLVKDSRQWWPKLQQEIREGRDEKARAYRKQQDALKEGASEDAQALRKSRIEAAQDWARKNDLDPSDSYWWAFYWNDPSLLRDQKTKEGEDEVTDKPLNINLADPVTGERRMAPEALEDILALPDISAKEMRGHKPRGRQVLPGDEEFEEASPESRKTSPEQEAKNRDRIIMHQRRLKAAYDRYKKKNPKTKLTLEQFTERYYNNKLRIPGGAGRGIEKALTRWDGDGVQGVGQPRDYHGRWTKGGGSLKRAAGAIGGQVEQSMNRAGQTPTRRASSKNDGWDHKKKGLAEGVKLTRLPHKGLENPSQKKSKYTPERALYLRNNGPTKITNKRLGEIYDAMFRPGSKAKPMTTEERHLLMGAGARDAQDGRDPVKVYVVRDRSFKPKPRSFLMNTIRKETANREAKKDPNAKRGAGGHIERREDIDREKKEAENAKRVASGRNRITKAMKEQMMKDFGDGKKAKCIFCGRLVDLSVVSPERMKPGPLDGKYERGNIAPAHEACNTKVGTKAQNSPEEYYEWTMSLLLKRYGEQEKLSAILRKNRTAINRVKRGKK